MSLPTLSTLRSTFEGLVFSRAKSVFPKGDLTIRKVNPDDSRQNVLPEHVCSFDKKDLLVVSHEGFSGKTGLPLRALRGVVKTIDLSHEGKCDAVIDGNGFRFVEEVSSEFAKTLPLVDGIYSDLICGLVEKKGKSFRFTKWFIASEQFLALYTLVMYEEHESFVSHFGSKSVSDRVEKAVKWCRKGNKLMTNAHRKFTLMHTQRGMTPDEEVHKLHRVLRSERQSIDHVHFYVFLVLKLVFEMELFRDDVPTTTTGLPLINWDLPDWAFEYISDRRSLKMLWSDMAEEEEEEPLFFIPDDIPFKEIPPYMLNGRNSRSPPIASDGFVPVKRGRRN